jgi:hypothetical protein
MVTDLHHAIGFIHTASSSFYCKRREIYSYELKPTLCDKAVAEQSGSLFLEGAEVTVVSHQAPPILNCYCFLNKLLRHLFL